MLVNKPNTDNSSQSKWDSNQKLEATSSKEDCKADGTVIKS